MTTLWTVRFFAMVDLGSEPGDCWLWQGYCTPEGYGQFDKKYAHRLIWELLIGPIPDQLTIDHLCRVRRCLNPAHLEVVTNKENILRGNSMSARYARRTHCVHGHEFTEENTGKVRGRDGRICRTCKSAVDRRYWHRKDLSLA